MSMFWDVAQEATEERIIQALRQELTDCKNKRSESNILSKDDSVYIENLDSYRQGILFAIDAVKKSNW